MHLGENLLPWKSKDKKCCLYKMPYVAAPVRVLGDVIAKFSTLCVTIFLGSLVRSFSRHLSRHIKTPTYILYKEVYRKKWYRKGLLIMLLEESHEEYLQVYLQADSTLTCHHEKNASGTLKIKMTARKRR
jgi:hypothetical protein